MKGVVLTPFFYSDNFVILRYLIMIILKVDTNPQTFEFIPRSKTYDGLFIRDESENIETQITISSSSSNDYYESITITEGSLLLESGGNILTEEGGEILSG